jgi:hypothetical protein
MVNQQLYFEAMTELGYESFSVEPDGLVWLGTEQDKQYVDPKIVSAKIKEIENRKP